MSEVKRYFIHTTDLRNINDDWFHNVEMSSKNLWDSGQVVELVHKEDYEKLKAQLEKAESALNKAINAADFFSRYADCNNDTWACRCEFCRDTTTFTKLREAREYFKEKEQK